LEQYTQVVVSGLTKTCRKCRRLVSYGTICLFVLCHGPCRNRIHVSLRFAIHKLNGMLVGDDVFLDVPRFAIFLL